MNPNIPTRIRRLRKAGWRKPEGALYVGRPSAWGNPFVLGKPAPELVRLFGAEVPIMFLGELKPGTTNFSEADYNRYLLRGCPIPDKATAKRMFRAWLLDMKVARPGLFFRLLFRVYDAKWLMCWCGAREECHADVWIEFVLAVRLVTTTSAAKHAEFDQE